MGGRRTDTLPATSYETTIVDDDDDDTELDWRKSCDTSMIPKRHSLDSIYRYLDLVSATKHLRNHVRSPRSTALLGRDLYLIYSHLLFVFGQDDPAQANHGNRLHPPPHRHMVSQTALTRSPLLISMSTLDTWHSPIRVVDHRISTKIQTQASLGASELEYHN